MARAGSMMTVDEVAATLGLSRGAKAATVVFLGPERIGGCLSHVGIVELADDGRADRPAGIRSVAFF